MPCVREVEHGPEVRVRIGFRDLVQRRIVRVDDLVDRRAHPRVFDGPLELSRSFAPNCTRFSRGVARVGGGASGGGTRWEEFGDAEIALRGGGEEVVDSVLVENRAKGREEESQSWEFKGGGRRVYAFLGGGGGRRSTESEPGS